MNSISGLSQQAGKGEGSPTRRRREGGSSPDTGGWGRYCQTGPGLASKRDGVREEPTYFLAPKVGDNIGGVIAVDTVPSYSVAQRTATPPPSVTNLSGKPRMVAVYSPR